jgi:hypothetical protein
MKGILVALAVLALVVAGVFMCQVHTVAKADQAHIQQANVDQADAHADAAKGAADVKPMQDERKQLTKDIAASKNIDVRLAADRVQVAKYHPRPVPGPGSPALPAVEAVAEPPESPRELAKDQMISDLNLALAARDKIIADQAKLNATTTDYGEHYQAAYTQDDAAVDQLRQAIHPVYHRAAGLLYAPGQSAVGVIVQQDLARVRLTAEIIQQGLPAIAGGRNHSLALVGVSVTF